MEHPHISNQVLWFDGDARWKVDALPKEVLSMH